MGRSAALAGATAAAVSLGVGELLAGLFARVASPLDAVGQVLIPRFPGAVTGWAIDTFGTANRSVLLAGIVLVAVGIGAAAGAASRVSGSPLTLALLLGGLAGVLAGSTQPGTGTVAMLLATGVAVTAGLLTFRALARLAIDTRTAPSTGPSSGGSVPSDGGTTSRRALLRAFGGVGAALLLGGSGRWLGSGTAVADPQQVSLPSPRTTGPAVTSAVDASAQIDGLSPVLTPNETFFRIDTALAIPRVDVDTWQLRITGLVERELTFSFDDLLEEPLREYDATIACVSNEVGGDLIGTARWLGTPLADLLERAGPRPEATQVVGRSVDGFTAGFPTEVALDGRDAIVAVGMNGEPLPARHGFPARLVVPGLFGYVSATKWLQEIELTTDEFEGYWIPRGWAKDGPVKTGARIDVPRRGQDASAGEVVIAGVAWAPTRGIERVEVQVDGGGWEAAELVTPLSGDTWVQWHRSVDLAAGEHQVRVRAVDGTGETQPEGSSAPAPDGAEGWHQRTFEVG